MKDYQKLNNIFGWVIFIIASIVYLMTIEPTTSFWDCGEYIATSYKLQVGHPPGAPMFQIIGRIFTLFAFGDVAKVAMWINIMSALCSSFTILFLFWSITMLARKITLKIGEINKAKMFAIFGSAAVGALAYTFSDTFWFSAVEGEVYAMSSFLTALVFWMMLKWEVEADDKYSLRWIVLISYVMGLSIGVHLLNLLTIPAMVFIFYFKKYEFTRKGFIITSIMSLLLLVMVQNGIIPWVVKLDWLFEVFFVNSLGLPFHSGTIFYFVLLITGIVYGLYYTHKHRKLIANTVILCFTFLVIGYSSFFLLIIRSNANTPINENSPTDALGLMAYLGREQYGDWPLLKGNMPLFQKNKSGQLVPYEGYGHIEDVADGNPLYKKDTVLKKYVIADERKGQKYVYVSQAETIFPRMWGSSANHISGYKSWGNIEGEKIVLRGGDVVYKPTFAENLRFFFTYQIGHMYLRYFFWNFVGRQNDIQGHGEITQGNWLSGINFIDQMRLGPQTDLPHAMATNKAQNKYYFLPLILGLIGLYYHAKKNIKDSIVVALLFLLTGVAIIIYLNQTPYQPRERDYAYAASFYAFAIWIAFGALAIIDFLSSKINPKVAVAITTIACLLLVPGIMAKENWDDHDRSKRYTARDAARNYLESCEKNAILFTNGDNDTFPLWYLQEVEGVRTDVKVCNLSLLNTDWYIDNMMRHKTYEADPIPLSLTPDKYAQGTRDYLFLREPKESFGHQELSSFIKYISDNNLKTYDHTKKFKITIDSTNIINTGTVDAKNAHLIEKTMQWEFPSSVVQKNHLIVLDMLVANNWERPIYFAITAGRDSYLGLDDYFQLEGMAYRLVPIKSNKAQRVNTDKMYDNVMTKFKWGNMNNPKVYLNEDNMRMAMSFRSIFAQLANALIAEGKNDLAIKALNTSLEVIPHETVPFNSSTIYLIQAFYEAGDIKKANELTNQIADLYIHELKYYLSFGATFQRSIEEQVKNAKRTLGFINSLARMYKQPQIRTKVEKELNDLGFLTEEQEFVCYYLKLEKQKGLDREIDAFIVSNEFKFKQLLSEGVVCPE